MALMSALIVSTILVGIVFIQSLGVFTTRFEILNEEYKLSSVARAQSCVHYALLVYTEHTNLFDECVIDIIEDNEDGYVEICTSGLYQHLYSSLKTTVHPQTLQFMRLEEI